MNSEKDYSSSYIRFATTIFNQYNGKEPFHLFLKNYFKSNKKHGSRDRRNIKSVCYAYLRLFHGFKKELSLEEKLVISWKFVNGENIYTLEGLDPDNIFPLEGHLSPEIERKGFKKSLLTQPNIYLRIRSENKDKVLRKFDEHSISFQLSGEDSISLLPETHLNDILKIDEEVVIQDYSSQKAISLLRDMVSNTNSFIIWDACAGSGGKSILIKDLFPNASLVVSDIRKSILNNLKTRLSNAGIHTTKLFVADLTKPVTQLTDNSVDMIVVDAPCSGSGTWSRTPERNVFFKESEIRDFYNLQRDILHNCLPKLKTGGYLLYLTCSVFQEENEENVGYFKDKHSLQIMKQEYFKGYEIKADTLFGGLLKKG